MGEQWQRGTIHAEGVDAHVRLGADAAWVRVIGLGGEAVLPAKWFTPDPDPYDGWWTSTAIPVMDHDGVYGSGVYTADDVPYERFYRDSAEEAKAAAEARLAELRDANRSTP